MQLEATEVLDVYFWVNLKKKANQDAYFAGQKTPALCSDIKAYVPLDLVHQEVMSVSRTGPQFAQSWCQQVIDQF